MPDTTNNMTPKQRKQISAVLSKLSEIGSPGLRGDLSDKQIHAIRASWWALLSVVEPDADQRWSSLRLAEQHIEGSKP